LSAKKLMEPSFATQEMFASAMMRPTLSPAVPKRLDPADVLFIALNLLMELVVS